MYKSEKVLNIYVDSEWGSNLELLSYQIAFNIDVNGQNHVKKILVIPQKVKDELYQKNIKISMTDVTDLIIIKDQTPVYDRFLKYLDENGFLSKMIDLSNKKTKKKKLMIQIHFYWSIVDLYHFFGESFILECIDNDLIQKRNNLWGRFSKMYEEDLEIQFVLKDKSGWVKKKGLKGLCDTLGIEHQSKNRLDEYKTHMESCLETQELFDLFVEYGMEDVVSLSKTDEKMVQFFNEISTEILKIPSEFEMNQEKLPSTMGSLVAQLFENFLLKEITSDSSDSSDSSYSSNISDLSNSSYQTLEGSDSLDSFGKKSEGMNDRIWKRNLERFKKINDKISVDMNFLLKKDKKKEWNEEKNLLSKRKESSLVSNCLNAGGIRSLGYLQRNCTGILNVLVQGGRTVNEKYESYFAQNIFDIDLTSCYASALKDFDFPIGLPTVHSYTDKNTCPTLRSFLEKNEKELIDNLYTITISGSLSFEQNFLYSKITDQKKLSTKINKLIQEEDTIEDLTGDFVILTQELENTILTSDILKTLKKVCTNQELNEIYDCIVVTAIYYKKSDFIENPKDWMNRMEENVGKKDYYYDVNLQSVVDKRSRKWSKVGLKLFFEPLIERRKRIKRDIRGLQDSTNDLINEIAKLQGLEQILKLICNTVYGVMASPYFAIGNTVLANNITARARNDVWLYCRALNGFLIITDGFQYQPEFVYRLKKDSKKPGLRILSDLRMLGKHRGIEKISLEDLDWRSIFLSQNPSHSDILSLDTYAKKHIQNFLEGYELSMNYDVEHKLENTALKMFYIKRAHYILERLEKKDILYKVRGTSEKENPVFLQVAKRIFTSIDENLKLEEVSVENIVLEMESSRISTLHDYKISKKKVLKLISDKNTKTSKNVSKDSFESSNDDSMEELNDSNDLVIEIPGRNKIVKSIFRLNSLDLPYRDLKDFQKRRQSKNYIDYGPLLKTMCFEKVFQQRMKDFQQSHNRKFESKKGKMEKTNRNTNIIEKNDFEEKSG